MTCSKCGHELNLRDESLYKKRIFQVSEDEHIELCRMCYTKLEKSIKSIQELLMKPMSQWTKEVIVKKFLEKV